MSGRVFVCHASQDAEMAQRVVAALEAAGVPCWIAPRNIDAGENYTQAILNGLEAAPAVVLIFSAATNVSPHVARELEIAVGSAQPIVPVRIEAIEPSGPLRYFIGASQWLDASGDWTPALVRAVRRAVGLPPAPAPPTTPTRSPVPPPPPTRSPQTALPTPDRDLDRAAVTQPGSAGRRAVPRAVLTVAGLVAAVVVAVAVFVILTGDDDDPTHRVAQDSGTPETGAPDDSSAEPSDTAQPVAAGPVTCWDGIVRADQGACPIPTGRKGMATVFPGLKARCDQSENPPGDKREAYVCHFHHYIVRYSRWGKDADMHAYYDRDKGEPSEPWVIADESAGWTWTALDRDPAETQDYQWTAAYENYPFSVSVEGKTHTDRSVGITAVEDVAVAPSRMLLQ